MLLKAIAEIAVLSFFAYLVLKFLQGTRGAGILRGLVILFVLAFAILSFLASKFDLYRIDYLLEGFLAFSLIFLTIIYQPEIRRGLVSLGQNPLLKRLFRSETGAVEEIARSVQWLAERKIGALIAIEQAVGLGNYVDSGTKIDAEVSQQLLTTIFWPGSPLHDGAVVVQGTKVAAAACLFPLSENLESSSANGFRHRAALGLTEDTDAMVIVVSEESGRVSLGSGGRLIRNVGRNDLATRLRQHLAGPHADRQGA